MINFLKNRHFLIDLVIKLITFIPPLIKHNIAKINFFIDCFFILNLEMVEGDYVEFGVFEGSSMIAAYRANLSSFKKNNISMLKDGPQRNYFGFDSFEEGFKIFDDKDKHPNWRSGSLGSSFNVTSKRLKRNIKKSKYTLIKGFVENTCKNKTPKNYGINKTSLVFFDMDLGIPTLIALEFIKDSLVEGSIIAFDQFFAYKGSKEKGESYAFEVFKKNNPNLVFRVYKTWGIRSISFMLTKIK